VVDLAVPRDVDPEVAALPGVSLVDLELLAETLRIDKVVATDELAVTEIVAAEVRAYKQLLRGADVAPTVAALRARADDVVSAELHRLRQRRADLTDEQRADVAHTVHRVVQRLLHSPTVRVRELAAGPNGDRYAELLRELFDLEVPPTAESVADVPTDCVEGDEA
jgi:glutamyl-tRNA reductase